MILAYIGGILTGIGLTAIMIAIAESLDSGDDRVSAWGLERNSTFGYDSTEGSLPKGYKPVPRERAELIRDNGRKS